MGGKDINVYYQQFGNDFRVKNNLLKDESGKDHFTSCKEALKAIDTLKTFPVISNFWTYDFVKASNFMIDTCDENIIAMYHFTDDDRVMGSIDEAKKLTQTVKNSKYTTKYIEEIGRIHVSLLTSNGKEIDENSYAYELAEISGGFVYSGIIQDEPAPMVMRLALTEDTTKTEQTKETNGNLTEILGEGNNGKFTVITSTGLIDSVKLKTVLNDSNGTDTDLDGLYDWDEVNTELIGKHLELENKQELKTINNSDLPLFSDLILHSSEWDSFKPYLWTEFDFARYAYANCFDNVRILPIVSSPVDGDGDNDGIIDNYDKNPLCRHNMVHDLTYDFENWEQKNADTFGILKIYNNAKTVSKKMGCQSNIYSLPKTSAKIINCYPVSSQDSIQVYGVFKSEDSYWLKVKADGVYGYIKWVDAFFIDDDNIVTSALEEYGKYHIDLPFHKYYRSSGHVKNEEHIFKTNPEYQGLLMALSETAPVLDEYRKVYRENNISNSIDGFVFIGIIFTESGSGTDSDNLIGSIAEVKENGGANAVIKALLKANLAFSETDAIELCNHNSFSSNCIDLINYFFVRTYTNPVYDISASFSSYAIAEANAGKWRKAYANGSLDFYDYCYDYYNNIDENGKSFYYDVEIKEDIGESLVNFISKLHD